MKNKIAFKLTLYFSVALIVFSVIIGGVFAMLFRSHTVAMHETDLERRALTMASTLSELMSGSMPTMGMRAGGYGAYFRFLDDIAMADVWIVDEDMQLLMSTQMGGKSVEYKDLPPDAERVVDEVFLGNTTFGEGFTNLLNAPTLTIGTPIMADGKVIGALLLHSPVEYMDEAVIQGMGILSMSMLAALALAVVLSVVLAFTFTEPLKKMKNAAMLLATGDYTAKTGVRQHDEIGELAQTIDLLSEKLDAAGKESAQLLQLRRDFVANISHELRTPVTVIRGSLEALNDKVVTEPAQVQSYYSQMLGEVLFLQRLVNDLLDLSRLQNTDFKIEMQQVNLCDVIGDAVRSAGQMAAPKHIKIALQTDASLAQVIGDYGRLRQMLMIVLDNAVKFSPPDSVVAVTLNDGVLSIFDKGPGIPKEDIPYIFDRFYKVKSEENKNGSGLGLAIAKQIAERHGVTLWADSELGQGSTFFFKF